MEEAEDQIQRVLKESDDIPLVDLSMAVYSAGVSTWAFNRAKSNLVSEGTIEVYQDTTMAGNFKKVRLASQN